MKDFYFNSCLREAGDISSNEEVSAGEECGLEAGGDPGGWEVSLAFFFFLKTILSLLNCLGKKKHFKIILI